MANSLLGAVKDIQAAFRANVTGLKQAPEMPPESANDFPFLSTYPVSGTQDWQMAGYRLDNHDLIIELHIMRKDLPFDLTEALRYMELIPAALKTAERAGGLSNICSFGAMDYVFGAMSWGDTENMADTVGIRWTLHNVRIEITV